MNKQYLMLSAALLLTGAAHAQGTELFFSEYNEGAHTPGTNYGGTANSTGNEKAIEVFNPTSSVVNLAPYSIRRYSNGSATPTEEERLLRSNKMYAPTGVNSLSSLATFVIAHPDVTLPDITRVVNQYSAPRATLTPTTVITLGGAVQFNGDDAMALVRYPSGTAGLPSPSAGVIVDIIGVIGFQPAPSGTGGTGNWSGTNPIDGTPAVFVASANQSIMRRPDISGGTRVNPTQATYNIATEWMQYSTAFNGPPVPPSTSPSLNAGGQLYNRLGEHNDFTGTIGTYGTLATLAKFNNGISIYPNPASGTATVELQDVKVGSIMVINNLGQRIVAQPSNNAVNQTVSLDISGLKAGLYFVQFVSADGQTRIFKELEVK